MRRVLNQRVHGRPADAVYVGRPSRWGNPFVIGSDGTRAEVIGKYEAWLLERRPDLLAHLGELRGRDLVCWCAPLACHADVLLRLANGTSTALCAACDGPTSLSGIACSPECYEWLKVNF